MLYDEDKAVEAIRGLDAPIRLHLAHVVRNGLQTIQCALETGQINLAKRNIRKLAENLKEMGI